MHEIWSEWGIGVASIVIAIGAYLVCVRMAQAFVRRRKEGKRDKDDLLP